MSLRLRNLTLTGLLGLFTSLAAPQEASKPNDAPNIASNGCPQIGTPCSLQADCLPLFYDNAFLYYPTICEESGWTPRQRKCGTRKCNIILQCEGGSGKPSKTIYAKRAADE